MVTRSLYEIEISGTTGDYDVCLGSEIDQIDDDETDSALFTVLSPFECSINDELNYYDYNNNIIYSGVIREIVNDNPKEIYVYKYDILLSDRIVNDIFENYTIEDLIDYIVTTYSTLTFSTSFVSGITLTRYPVKNKNALQVIKDLIALVPNLTFNVDKNKLLTLFLKDSVDSSVVLTNGDNSIVNNGWSQDTSNQVTRLTLIGEKQVQQDKEQSFNGTGAQTVFTISEIPTSIKVVVDSVEQTLSVDGQVTGGDYTVSPETKKITFLSGSIPAIGTNNVVITYTFEIDITLEFDASLDIQNTYGIIEKKVTKKYINTMDDAFSFCSQYIEKYSIPLLNSRIDRTNNYDISSLIPGYKIYVIDNINKVNNSYIARFFTITRVKRTFPGGITIEVGDLGVSTFNILSETKYNVNQLYEQDNNSSIIQKSQIINNTVNVEVSEEVELQLYRDLPTNYMYLGDANDSPVYANIGAGTARPLRNAGDTELFFITNKDNWNGPDEEIALHGFYVSWNDIT